MSCRRSDCDKPEDTRGFCSRHYRYMLHTGRFGYVEATPARLHVLKLRELGWTYELIAAAAGMANWTGNQLARGELRHVLPETARAILSIQLVPQASHRGVDGTGTYRRVEALQWMGWPMHAVARRCGIAPYTLTTYRARREPVSYRLKLAVETVYRELAHLPGPSKQTATKAKRSGYVSPMAWDDDIDDPNATPEGTDLGPKRGKLPPADEIRFLLRCGESVDAIAARFGATAAGLRSRLRAEVSA